MAQKERLGKVNAKTLALNGTSLGSVVQGAASGYKVARGVASITGTGTVTHGLASVVAVVVSTVTVKVWKPTASGDCTPIAATAAKNVNWLVIGT
jgi:hypothetical protein